MNNIINNYTNNFDDEYWIEDGEYYTNIENFDRINSEVYHNLDDSKKDT